MSRVEVDLAGPILCDAFGTVGTPGTRIVYLKNERKFMMMSND